MKKLFFLLLMFITLSVNAQVASTSVENITAAERIVDKYATKAFDTVKDVVTELSGPAQEAFGYVVKLQIAKGIGGLLPPIFLVLTLIATFKMWGVAKWDRGEVDNAWAVGFVMGCVLSIVFLAISLFTTYGGVLHLIAPEWYAIKELVDLVK